MKETIFFQAMIYLAAAVIMVPIAKKLGLGSVLGYLFAGVIIGPACFKFIGREGEDLMHFAEFGVVMMLFIVGLELEPSRLWRMKKSIAGMGGLQLLLTTALVTVIASRFGITLKQSIALGMIVSMSSTAIVLQSLAEKGQLKSAGGQNAFAVLLFQDIAVIPILAIMPLLAAGGKTGAAGAHTAGLVDMLPSWAQPLAVLGSVALVIFGGHYILRPVFRLIAKTGLREIFTAAALLLVVGIAVLMTSVGLSPALGTFLAGVVLANSEYRHELESDIDPFKGLLLGLFFIAVGASINFHLIGEKPLIIAALVFSILFIKWLVLFLLGKSFRMNNTQNFIFSFGLCQIGEFAFVLFSFSLQEGILPKNITDSMIAVVAITMALTPLVMLLNEKIITPWLGRQPAAVSGRESDVMSEDAPVIIAGCGHFGNMVGRLLSANGVKPILLDSDADNVDRLRKMGFRVYFGDASRADLLEIAGAAKAKLIIITIGEAAKRLELIDTIKKHFPNLNMLVRSTNRYDAYDLMNAGMLHIYRETIDTSLRMGVDAMKMLGYRAHEALRSSKAFFIQDEINLKYLSSIRNDEEYINAIRKYNEDLEASLQVDAEFIKAKPEEGWTERDLGNLPAMDAIS